MLDKNTPIQFILAEGASAKLDGFNIVRGLRRLGYNANYWFNTKYPDKWIPHFEKLHPEIKGDIRGNLHTHPEYVFTVKPLDDELLIKFKSQGAKIAYIFEDETLPLERTKIYDFIVASSFGWRRMAASEYSGRPCYLIRDEQDFYTTKIHSPSSNLKIVTSGHMENLKHHFNILPILRQKYSDITIVSNWIDKEVFPDVQFEKWVPHGIDYFDENYDRVMTEQFLEYDVVVLTQYPTGLSRNSSRLRNFVYAGLPVVAINSENHRDLWLNGDGVRVFLVTKESDWLKCLFILEDYKIRQEIVDYNYGKCKRWAGIEQAALTFVKAIEEYEKR